MGSWWVKETRPMVRRLAVLGLLLVLSASSCAVAQDERNSRLAAAAKAYAGGDFAKSETILEELVIYYPQDSVVHYLLGNSYLAAGKLELAEREYELSLKFNPPASMVAQTQQALGKLRSMIAANAALTQAARQINNPAPVPALPPVSPGAQPPIDPNLALDEQKLADQQQELIQRADDQQSERTKHHRRIADTQIARIEREAEDDIASLAKYTYNYRGRQVKNPTYDSDVSAIRAEAERKKKVVLDALEKNTSKLSTIGNKTRNDIMNMASNLRDAAQSDKGSSRLMPNGSNLYTKNYVNFGEEDVDPQPAPVVEPMRATYSPATVKPIGTKKP